METIPHGALAVQATDRRFEITTPGALYGENVQVFDKTLDAFERDGTFRCTLREIERIEVQPFFQTHGFLVVVFARHERFTIYTDDDKVSVDRLAQSLGRFLSVEVVAGEPPGQRAVQEALGSLMPPRPDAVPADPSRYGLPLGAARRPVGLFTLLSRTGLTMGIILLLVGLGVIVLTVVPGNNNAGTGGIVIGLVFVAAGALFTWQGSGELRVWRAIQASPVPVEAMVLGIKQVSTRRPRYALKYAYRDRTGQRHTGESHSLKPEEAGLWQPYDIAEVHIDGQRPERSMLVGERPTRQATPQERERDGGPGEAGR